MFEDAAARFQQWRQGRAQTAADYSESKRPVADETKGLNLQERYDRLAKNNILPKIETVAKALGTPNPSQGQQVEFGEKGEQEARDQRRQEIEQSGTPTTVKAQMVALAVLLGVKLPAAAAVATFGLEKMGSRLMEGNEHLRRWSGIINTAFARLEHQALVLDARTARATSGSAGALGSGLKSLRDEMQPMREAMATIKNLAGLGLVTLARIANVVIQMNPIVQEILRVLQNINILFGGRNEDHSVAFVNHFWQKILIGKLGDPDNPNNRPRPGPQVPGPAEPPPRGGP